MSIYAVLQPRGTQDAGVWSLIEQVEPGEFRIVARGAKDELLRLSGKLNSDPADPWIRKVDLPPTAQIDDDGPVIGVREVESWTDDERRAARDRIIPEPSVGYRPDFPTLYREPNGRYYSTEAAKLITGQAFIKPKPRRLTDSPQA